MADTKQRHIRLSILISAAALLWVIGTGFFGEILAGNDETYKGLKVFGDVIEEIEKNYVDEVESSKLIQDAIKGMVHSLDPHSQYLPPEEYEELQTGTKGEFEGVGIVITMPKGVLTVVSPIEGTPAYKAGIMAKDIILKVDGENTGEMTLSEAVKKIKGPKGTKVILTIYRETSPEPIDFKLTRDVIPIESVKYVKLKEGYGYVWITHFQDNTTRDLEKALKKMKPENGDLKGLILDLRNNPGGLLDQSITVSDMFLEKGTILSIKGRLESHTNVYDARPERIKRDYPMVVLINGGSASASEIVAGALQDHKRAVILGTTSFGKGSVQTVKPLRDGSGLKYTIARYYSPSGKAIQAKGIEPDIVVERILSDGKKVVSDTNRLKEKDLKNHLEAEPSGDADKDDSNSSREQKKNDEGGDDTDLEDSRYGDLSAEKLLKDNQVSRALDILVSYDVFKDITGVKKASGQ